MYTYLHYKFCISLESYVNNKHLKSILIAISGGQDSLCLIQLIEDYQDKFKTCESLNIEYIYIDHQWRKDSQQQIQHIINFANCRQRKISVYEIQSIAKSEIEARNLRYQTIIQHALTNKYPLILTAHTATDRVETFFQQIIRGTSLDGATGLHIERRVNSNLLLVRPLLNFNRTEINWFCRRFYLPTWSDITNYEYRVQRNRLRYEFIPYLKRYFTKSIEQKISSFLEISSLDNEYIKQNSIKLYLDSMHSVSVAINYERITTQHICLQTRVLQVFFYHNFNKTLTYYFVYTLLLKLQTINPNKSNLTWQNFNFQMHKSWLYIY
uniref:tRNA(Ile)-lysidine synthase n=1 Tax=Gloiopeltis furcata TaxID=42017 RepID=UPI0028D4BF56|nr:tRNA(Ile)-lysidine synthase [Gloiopeltis furcata]WMP13840.1 tRNA(Ile)-lysidine synthase [Gloiopeltis furcata]